VDGVEVGGVVGVGGTKDTFSFCFVVVVTIVSVAVYQ